MRKNGRKNEQEAESDLNLDAHDFFELAGDVIVVVGVDQIPQLADR